MMSELFSKSNDGQIQQNGLIMSTDEVIDYLNTSNNAIGSLQYENAQLRKENKRLKKSEKINMEYAEQIVEENQQLRIAKNDLRIENEQLHLAIDDLLSHTSCEEIKKENEQLRKQVKSLETTSDATSNYNAHLESKITTLEKENEKLQKENEKIQEEIKELKIERDDWKSSTYSYMNKDSILSMDCQIVREALWELEKEIEFGSKREDLFFDLKEKFEKLNNHRIGVYE